MIELQAVVRAALNARQNGQAALLATVVDARGSTYRRPGARMLLTENGWEAGSISGGCLEGDVLQKAWWRTENGPVVVTYDSRDSDDDVTFGFGLGCNGAVDVLLERLPSDAETGSDVIAFMASCLASDDGGDGTGVLATVFRDTSGLDVGARAFLPASGGDGAGSGVANAELRARVLADAQSARQTGRSSVVEYALTGGGTATALIEAVAPPLSLVIWGAGHDAAPVVRAAKLLGWRVTVVDTRSARPRPERFPLADSVIACAPGDAAARVPLTARTATVLMTHNYHDDRDLLPVLLASPAFYVGALGPRNRADRLLAEIGGDGVVIPSDQLSKLAAPVGLDIGADNPDEIALSIVAEIQAVVAGRAAGRLRDRKETIHARPVNVAAPPQQNKEAATCPLTTRTPVSVL